MTPNTQTSNGLSNSKPAPVDRVKQLAAILLSERGEASGAQVARELHHVLHALDTDDRHSFQRYLATEFQPDKAALRAAAERYLADTTAEAAAALAQAADPPRQELLRRMNMAPGGTGALIAMRGELTAHRPLLLDRVVAEDELDALARQAASADRVLGLADSERMRHSLLLVAAAIGSVSALAAPLAALREAVESLTPSRR